MPYYFFAVLLNALLAVTEINNLYDQRSIIEKQASYAFCHPFAEALAGITSDIPVKFMIAVCFNIVLYFLGGLRREPLQFFLFFLFVSVAQLTMTNIFRTVAAATKTLSQALSIAGVLVLAVVIYTGFTIPRPYMISINLDTASMLNVIGTCIRGSNGSAGLTLLPMPSRPS